MSDLHASGSSIIYEGAVTYTMVLAKRREAAPWLESVDHLQGRARNGHHGAGGEYGEDIRGVHFGCQKVILLKGCA